MLSSVLIERSDWRWRLGLAGLVSLLLAGIVVALAWNGTAGSGPRTPSAAATRPGLTTLPLAARGPISGAMGSADRAYSVRRGPIGLSAVNTAQGLRLSFGRSSVSVRSGSSRLSLRLVGVGYGSSLMAVSPVGPRYRGNRVSYTRGAVAGVVCERAAGTGAGIHARAQAFAGFRSVDAVARGRWPSPRAREGSVGFEAGAGSYFAMEGWSRPTRGGSRLPASLALSGEGFRSGSLIVARDIRSAIDPFVQQATDAGRDRRGRRGRAGM